VRFKGLEGMLRLLEGLPRDFERASRELQRLELGLSRGQGDPNWR